MSAKAHSPKWRQYLAQAAGSYRYAVLLTLAGVLATAIGIAQSFRAAWQEAGEHLIATSRLQVGQVEVWLQERQVDVRNMVQMHDLLLQRDPACESPSPHCDEHIRRILTVFLNNGGFRSIAMAHSPELPPLRVGAELRASDL